MADPRTAGAPKPNAENEDPIFAEILKSADLISYIGVNARCYPVEAFSAEEWSQMLFEVFNEVEEIQRLCGVASIEDHQTDAWSSIGDRRNSSGQDYRPYKHSS